MKQKDIELAKAWMMSHVIIDKNSGCYKWTYALATEYNRAKCGGENVKKYGLVSGQASRSAYALWYPNKFDPDLMVLHGPQCPAELASQCVNPKHLHQGTCRQNQQEKYEFGLGPKGEAHPNAVLTNKQVIKIRRLKALGKTVSEIAIALGMPRPSPSENSREYNRIATLIRSAIVGWKHI